MRESPLMGCCRSRSFVQSGRGCSAVRIAICQDGRGPYARMVENASCLPGAGYFRKLYATYLLRAVDLQVQEFSFHSMDTASQRATLENTAKYPIGHCAVESHVHIARRREDDCVLRSPNASRPLSISILNFFRVYFV